MAKISKERWNQFWSKRKHARSINPFNVFMSLLRYLAIFLHFRLGKRFFSGKGLVLEVGCGGARASILLTGGKERLWV